MINSSLRRTALAAAAAACLSLPAAAQSDAALSVALGALHAPLAAMAQLKTQSQTPAPPQLKGPTAPADLWKKILDSARKGTFAVEPNGIIRRKRDAQIDYSATSATQHHVTVFSTVRPDGHEGVGGALFVVSEFNMDAAGVMRIDHWVFGTNRSGQLLDADHHVDIDGKNRVTSHLGLGDPQTKTRFDEMVKFWAAR